MSGRAPISSCHCTGLLLCVLTGLVLPAGRYHCGIRLYAVDAVKDASPSVGWVCGKCVWTAAQLGKLFHRGRDARRRGPGHTTGVTCCVPAECCIIAHTACLGHALCPWTERSHWRRHALRSWDGGLTREASCVAPLQSIVLSPILYVWETRCVHFWGRATHSEEVQNGGVTTCVPLLVIRPHCPLPPPP